MKSSGKNLHRHAAPLVVLVLGLVIVSMVGMSQFMRDGTTRGDSVTSLLTARLLSIRAGANGLFHISRYQSAEQTASSQLRARSANTGLEQISTSGASAGMSVMVNSLGQASQ